jgi:predicted hydrocarbon binding protein
VSWIAPEIFEQRKYTEKADVYSFGIVLWELYTRKVPFTDIHSFSIPVAVIKGDRPPVPKDCPPPLKKLIRQCWDSKPAKRPALSKVIETIQKIYEQLPPLARSQTTINMQPLTKSSKKSKPGKNGAGGRHQGRRLKEALDSEYDDDASAMLTNGPAGAAVGTIDEASSNTLSSPSTSTIDSGGATIDSSKRQDSSADLFESISDSVSVSGTTSYSESPTTSPSTSKKHASALDSPDSKSLSRRLSDKSTGAHSVGVKLAHTVTCHIPDQWAPPIARLEIQVNKYFSRLKQDLDLGTITVGEERYLLFRGHSLAVDFLKMIQASFEFDNEHDSVEFAQNFLYDLGSGIGKNDAANFLNTVAVDDPLARQNLGLVVVAYTGMAFVSLLPESSYNPKKPEDELMAYEFVYSFEADSWAKKGRKDIDFTTCMMSAGYLSGWGEGATGHVRATAELECCSKGDHRCLFVRSSPLRLESNVRKFVEEHKIDKPEPIPRFLRNRSDTLPPSMQKKPAPASPDEEDEADLNWFEAGFKKLWKRFNSSNSAKQPERVEAGSPKPLPKLTAKRFSPPELSIDEIDRRASQELNSFFIDPTTATVEMAEERCVLLRGDALAYGFNEMVGELFKGEDRHTLSNQFSQKFLFELGRTIGSSNQSWFVEKIGLGHNAIERAWALPVNMAYFGWCDLVIRSGLSYKELQKQTENFKIICDVNNSFEAASYLKHKKKKDYKSPVCHMHAGYISGWFEASFKTKVVAVETLCKAQGHPHCQFVIGHANNIKKHISQQFHGAVNSALSTSVLPLLAKFKEKRRESGKLKKEELVGGS